MKNKEVTGMHLKKHIVFLIIVILYFITSGLYYLEVLLHICSLCTLVTDCLVKRCC